MITVNCFFDMNSQREENQWNVKWKSDLVHSLIQGYFVPEVHIVQDGTRYIKSMSVFEGKQRITSVREYVLNLYPLNEYSRNSPSSLCEVVRKYHYNLYKSSHFDCQIKFYNRRLSLRSNLSSFIGFTIFAPLLKLLVIQATYLNYCVLNFQSAYSKFQEKQSKINLKSDNIINKITLSIYLLIMELL